MTNRAHVKRAGGTDKKEISLRAMSLILRPRQKQRASIYKKHRQFPRAAPNWDSDAFFNWVLA